MRTHMKWGIGGVAVITVAALTTAAVPAQAAGGRHTLSGSVPAWATSAGFKGNANNGDHIGFRVYLGWRSDPSAFDRAVSTPGSAEYGHYLSAAAFRAQYSPSAADVSAVQQWLAGNGFQVGYTPANNLFVTAEGSVAQVNQAFGTTIGYYQVGSQTLHAPESAVSIPSTLPKIDGVIGLDDSLALVHTDHVTADASPSPGFRNGGPCSTYLGQDTTSNTTEPTPLITTGGTITTPSSVTLPDFGTNHPTDFAVCGYTPAQLRGAYGLSSSDTGAGQTVAIIDAYASPTIVTDANTYFSHYNAGGIIPALGSSNFTQVVPPGIYNHPESGINAVQDPQGWYGEETLDVEAVHTMAPAAHIVYVGAPNNYQDLDAALTNVVDNQLATLVTNSYGWSSEALPADYILPYEDVIQQAVAEGIGVYFSSGDNGDETGGVAGASPTPDWPASSPFVTAVGGTSLAVGASNTRAGEWGWETGRARLHGTSASTLSWGAPAYQYGSGGGVSRLFTQPAYQAGVVPGSMAQYYSSTPMRVVPDVAALGDPTTGMLIGQTQTFPDGTYWATYRIGGTSLASPLFTGMMADAQALRHSQIGFANPLLYANAGALRDIVPASGGDPTALVRSDYANTVDATNGYVATVRAIDFDGPLTIHVGTGYDDVTGLGSPGSAFFSTLG